MTYQYVTQQGIVVADTSDVLAQVQSEYKQVYGDDLNVDPSTPQGVQINSETASRTAVMQNNAQIANQINPQQSADVFLDALCALMGLQRAAATFTQVTNAKMTGVPQRTVPGGARAKTAAGDIFALASGVTFDNSGDAWGTFQAVASGPIPCANGALSQIVDNILGWETVINDQIDTPISVTTIGANQQKDGPLKILRNETLARQGISTREAQIAGLRDPAACPGVTGVAYRENYTNATAVIDGVMLVAHSVWACVDGGLDSDIGMSLLKNKTDGANWNGATTVNITDPASKQVYAVQFDRPSYVFIYIAVSVKQGSYTGDLISAVPQAIVDYFAGNVDGFASLDVGDSVSAFEIAAAIGAACPGCVVMNVSIGTSPSPTSSATITLTQKQRAQTNTSACQVTVVS